MNYELTAPTLGGQPVANAASAQMPTTGEQAPASHQYLLGVMNALNEQHAQQDAAAQPQQMSNNPYAGNNPNNPYAINANTGAQQGAFSSLLGSMGGA